MRKGNVLISVLIYLAFITIVVFIMFGKLDVTKNEFIDLQRTEKARINAINASNLARAYISNYSDAVLGLLRIAGFSSHQNTPPTDIKDSGDSIVEEIMAQLESKNPSMVEMFKDETRDDPYDWIWVLHKNFSDPSDPLNSINLIKITKGDQEYNIEDILSKEGILDLFVVFAKDNKNIALVLSRSKFSKKSFIVYSLVGKDTLAKYGTFLNSWPGDGYWTSNYKFYGDLRLNVEPIISGHPHVFGDYYAPDLNDDGKNWRGDGSFEIDGENYFIGGDELNKYNFDAIREDYGDIIEYGTPSGGGASQENGPWTLVVDVAKSKGAADFKSWIDNLYKLIKPEGYMKGLWIRNKIVRTLIPERVKIENEEIQFPIRVLADVDNDGENEEVELALAVGESVSGGFSATDPIVNAFKSSENSPDVTLKFLDESATATFNKKEPYTVHYVYYDGSEGVWKMLETPIATVAQGEEWPEVLDPSTVTFGRDNLDIELNDNVKIGSKDIYQIINVENPENPSPYLKVFRIYGKDEIHGRKGFIFETFPFQFNGIIDLDKHDVILGDISGNTNQDLCLVNGKYTIYTKNNIYQISSIIYQDYAQKVKERFNIDLDSAAQVLDNYPEPYAGCDLGDGSDMIYFLRNNSNNVDDFLNLVCEEKYYAIGNTSWQENFKSLDIEKNADMKLFGAIYAIGKNSELTSNYKQMNMHSTFWIYGSGVLQTEGITEEGGWWFSRGYSLNYAHDERIKRGVAAWNYGTPGAPSEIQVYGMGVLEE